MSALLKFSQLSRPAWQRHLAYIAIGLFIWLGLVAEPGRPSSRAPAAIGAGALLTLILLMFVAGPIIGGLTPVWRALGQVPTSYLGVTLASLVLWRAHTRGQRYCTSIQ